MAVERFEIIVLSGKNPVADKESVVFFAAFFE
jgi:hypothetical protein